MQIRAWKQQEASRKRSKCLGSATLKTGGLIRISSMISLERECCVRFVSRAQRYRDFILFISESPEHSIALQKTSLIGSRVRVKDLGYAPLLRETTTIRSKVY